jgi:CBS domain-containing protein
MRIEEILLRKGHDVVTVPEGHTVLEAVRVLVDRNIGALVVTAGDGPVGIFTERDVLRLTARRAGELGSIRVEEVMTRDPITASPEDNLTELMDVMTTKRIRHLPVADGGRLVGIVSIGDLLNACRSEAEEENSHLRQYIHGMA